MGGDFLYWLELTGVAVFALTGALAAARQRLDIFGFALVASVTGIGGGTLRDLLLDIGPVFWIAAPLNIGICIAVASATFFLAQHIAKGERAILWADALGMALFCVLGAERALNHGATGMVAVVMGVMSATFWSVMSALTADSIGGPPLSCTRVSRVEIHRMSPEGAMTR